MTYLKRFHTKEEWVSVSREEAEETVLTTYDDNDEVRGWLLKPGVIQCRFSTIKVVE